MYDLPRQKLCELIDHYGTMMTEDVTRCESLLYKSCGDEYKREIFVLIHAIKEGVVKELLHFPSDEACKHLAQQLHDKLWLDTTAAEWAVHSWKIALKGKIQNPLLGKNAQIQTASKVQLHLLNPLDYIRLLWWVLAKPQQLSAYRQLFGSEDDMRLGNWLISTLIWGPLLLLLQYLPEMSFVFDALIVGAWIVTGSLKMTKNMGIVMTLFISIVVSVLVSVSVAISVMSQSLILGLISSGTVLIALMLAYLVAIVVASDMVVVITVLTSIGVAVGMAVGVAFVDLQIALIAGGIAGILAGFVMDVMTNSVGKHIKESVITGNPSVSGHFAFLLLVITHLFLMGCYALITYQNLG